MPTKSGTLPTVETFIENFGSMTPNFRKAAKGDFAFSCHFNPFKNGTLAPNRTYTAITDGGEKITRFLYGKVATNYGFTEYGLGDNGSGKNAIFYKAPTDTAWTSTGVSSADNKMSNPAFALYKNQLYFWSSTGLCLAKNLAGGLTISGGDPWQSISATNIAQPLHYKSDDFLYIFHDNIVARATDATTFADNLLTLPSNLKIMGAASFGAYLAIAASPIQPGTGNSVLFIWDRDSSLVTVSNKIDLGPGIVTYISESADGGVWIVQDNNSTFVSGFAVYNNSIQVKYYNGSLIQLDIPNGQEHEYFSQIRTFNGSYLPMANSVEKNNIFYFPAEVITNLANESRDVIFAVRRTSQGLRLVADQEITTAGGTGFYINGIFELGNHFLISYTASSGAIKTQQTVLGSTYQTSIFESAIFAEGTPGTAKQLIGVTVTNVPLPSGATITMKYRKDEETAWTTIFTNSTQNSLHFDATSLASGGSLPHYLEIQFRIESTGGAEITGFSWKSQIEDLHSY